MLIEQSKWNRSHSAFDVLSANAAVHKQRNVPCLSNSDVTFTSASCIESNKRLKVNILCFLPVTLSTAKYTHALLLSVVFLPGSDFAHLTAEMTCCPPSLLRVVMSRVEVSGSVPS